MPGKLLGMTPEVRDYLSAARQCLAEAKRLLALPMPHIAACEAYLAGYYATEAYMYQRTGKAAKTHSDLRADFASLAKDDPQIPGELVTFPAKAYELKSLADYAINPAPKITDHDATAAIETADRFVDCIDRLILSKDSVQTARE
jgi:uncharacterized protein (UPF0332 family)